MRLLAYRLIFCTMHSFEKRVSEKLTNVRHQCEIIPFRLSLERSTRRGKHGSWQRRRTARHGPDPHEAGRFRVGPRTQRLLGRGGPRHRLGRDRAVAQTEDTRALVGHRPRLGPQTAQ